MKKDSIDTYRRMKKLAEKLGKREEAPCCITLEMWAGGCWRAEVEISFKKWIGGQIAKSCKANTLEELEKMEVSYDSTT